MGAGNALLIQRRAKPLIEKNPNLQFDANKVSVTLVLMVGIPSALLGIIQLLAGYQSPLYIFSDDLSNGYLLAAWLVLAGLRLFILGWLWLTTGVESYMAITPIKISKPQALAMFSGATIIRMALSLIIVSWFLVVFVQFY